MDPEYTVVQEGSRMDSLERDQDVCKPIVRHKSQFNPGKIVRGAFPIIREYNRRNMPQDRVLQYQKEFNLPETEKILGRYMCVHVRGGLGAMPAQGELFISTSYIIFRSNVLGYLQTMMLPFTSVTEIRTRTTMMLPNTIAIEHQGGPGEAKQKDVFTNFFFSSRNEAFETLRDQWRDVRPEEADAAPDMVEDDVDSEDNGGPCEGLPPLVAVPDDSWPERQEGMVLLLERTLPGVEPTTLAEVLLADSSGFIPALALAQGNEPKDMSPWTPCPPKHNNNSSSSGGGDGREAAERLFDYIYKGKGPFGTVQSKSTVEQQLTLFEGGRLLMEGKQQMPELPNGVGKCFHIETRWEVVPLSGEANTIQNVCLCPSPTAATTAAAAAGAWEESAAAFNRNSVTGVTGAGDGAADCKKNRFAPMPVIKSLEEYLDDQAAGTSSSQTGGW